MKRQKQLHVMLTEEEKLLLEGKAQQLGTTMSVYLRLMLRRDLGLGVTALPA